MHNRAGSDQTWKRRYAAEIVRIAAAFAVRRVPSSKRDVYSLIGCTIWLVESETPVDAAISAFALEHSNFGTHEVDSKFSEVLLSSMSIG